MKRLLSALFACATLLQFSALALPSYDLIAHEEQPGWTVGQAWVEAGTNKVYKVIAVQRIETPDEILYQPYITCFQEGDTLAMPEDCGTETAADLMGR